MGILGAIGAGLGIASTVSGFFADKKTNKLNKKQFELQEKLANKQISYSDYIMELSKAVMEDGYSIDNSGVVRDEKGNFVLSMEPQDQAIQNASDQEELKRYTVDQEMRRRGLQDVDRRRNIASGEADTALRDLNSFKAGVGQIDPTQLGNQIALQRMSQVNAGFDDAENAAAKLQLRTGSSAVGDAIANLGRERTRAMSQIGDPALEGLMAAEDINNSRFQNKAGTYDLFTTQANQVYDAGFGPSDKADKLYQKGVDARNFELGKNEVAMGGAAGAAAGVGSAAAGQRQGFGQFMQNRISDPFGNFLSGLSGAVSGLGGMGGGGGSSSSLGGSSGNVNMSALNNSISKFFGG
jgi:hypothetical protein